MYNVTDANGKEISFTLDQLQDVNYNFFDNTTRHSVSSSIDMTNFIVPIVDESGEKIGEVGDITKITDSNGELPRAIMVDIECTHSGDNHNYAIYHSDSMENDSASLIYPYNKPFIKNHDRSTEPLGRIMNSQFKESEICPERDTISIGVKVSDSDAIQKFIDGRYKTVSIGASVGHIKCNICGKDILKDKKVKFCGHFKGEKYGDNMALWHLRDLTYNECSVVNSPADDWAQVTKITVLSDSKEDDNAGDDNVSKDNTEINENVVNDSSNDESILDNMDNLIASEDENTNEQEDNQVEGIENTQDGDTDNEEAKDNDKINELLDEILNCNKNLELKDQVIMEQENKISNLNDELENTKASCDEYRKISVSLANLNKTLLVDKVMLLSDNLKTLEDYNDREELTSLTTKDLNEIIVSISNQKDNQVRTIHTVENPALVNQEDNHSIIDDENEAEVVENKSDVVKDHVSSIINNLCK